jgi:hypothetical protein
MWRVCTPLTAPVVDMLASPRGPERVEYQAQLEIHHTGPLTVGAGLLLIPSRGLGLF